MNASFSDIVNYFELLATTHRDIGHSPRKKHFIRLELDELLSGLNRTDIAYPLLVLEAYSYKFTDHNSDNVLKNRSIAFMLIDHVSDAGDYTAIHATWDKLETIADELFRRIRADKRNPAINAVRDFQIDDVEAEIVYTELNSHTGLRFTFDIKSTFVTDINPDKWL